MRDATKEMIIEYNAQPEPHGDFAFIESFKANYPCIFEYMLYTAKSIQQAEPTLSRRTTVQLTLTIASMMVDILEIANPPECMVGLIESSDK